MDDPPRFEVRREDQVCVRSHLCSWSGYGRLGLEVAKALLDDGHRVGLHPYSQDARFLAWPEWVASRLVHQSGLWRVCCNTPYTFKRHPLGAQDVAVTMWETTRLPEGCVESLNRARAVIVPSHWCATVFSACGVTVPIRVVPLGVEPDQGFRFLGPKLRPVGQFVFGTAGRLSHGGDRKGLVDVIQAFRTAFPRDPQVRLEVKCWPDCGLPEVDDSRIHYNRQPLLPSHLAGWYRNLDCYVTATRGEGFGLQPLEAMSVGTPVIAPRWSGLSEYFDSRAGWELPFDLKTTHENFFQGTGLWAVPTYEGLVETLLLARGSNHSARASGERAAKMASGFTWRNFRLNLVKALRSVNFARTLVPVHEEASDAP